MACEYEKLRLKNLEDNKRVLAELGLMNPFAPKRVQLQKKPAKRKAPTKEVSKARVVVVAAGESHASDEGTPHKRRRSCRLRGQTPEQQVEEPADEPEEEEGTPRLKAPLNRPNFYGEVPGVPIGTAWDTRLECCIAGIHRPTVAGIHGGPDGAYSIALSGGYDDNVDLGECFTYTGEGGRDLKGTKANPKNLRTAAQSKDQTLSRGNLALTKNVETREPVRVIRGYKLPTQYAPDEGYRYDGLYKVEKYWFTTGLSGFGVFKFALRRLENQAPPPWNYIEEGSQNAEQEQKQQVTNEDEGQTFPSEGAENQVAVSKCPESIKEELTENPEEASQDSGIESQESQGSAITNTEEKSKDSITTSKHKEEIQAQNGTEDQTAEGQESHKDKELTEKPEAASQDSGIESQESQGSAFSNTEEKSKDSITTSKHEEEIQAQNGTEDQKAEGQESQKDKELTEKPEAASQDSGIESQEFQGSAITDTEVKNEDSSNATIKQEETIQPENAIDDLKAEEEESQEDKEDMVKCEEDDKENVKGKENVIDETPKEDENSNVAKQNDIEKMKTESVQEAS